MTTESTRIHGYRLAVSALALTAAYAVSLIATDAIGLTAAAVGGIGALMVATYTLHDLVREATWR